MITNDNMNPYEILGVKIGASINEIKTAYKNLARKYHPDISKKPNALEMMKKINNAYDILTKPQIQRRTIQQPQTRRVVIIYGSGFGYGGYYSGTTTNY